MHKIQMEPIAGFCMPIFQIFTQLLQTSLQFNPLAFSDMIEIYSDLEEIGHKSTKRGL